MVESGAMKSWIDYDSNNQFPLENIPFGVFRNSESKEIHCCTRIGDHIIDLAVLEHSRKCFTGPLFSKMEKHVFCEPNLNAFAAMGPEVRKEARESIQAFFIKGAENATMES